MDQCKHCTVRDNLKECIKTECSIHENWYVSKLHDVILGLIDAHYGTSLHHVGDGDGLTEVEADNIKTIMENFNIFKHYLKKT